MASLCTSIRSRLARLLALPLIVAVALLVVACNGGGAPTPIPVGPPCPVPTPNLLPTPWIPLGNGTLINIDPDDETECVLVYRYNITGGDQGPLGGVIFDPQAALLHLSDLSGYRLLPWINRGYTISGAIPGSLPANMGMIGERGYELRLYDADADPKGKADELGIIGTDLAGNKAYLSIYRWLNDTDGYGLVGYFHGNARVEIVDPPPMDPVTRIQRGPVRIVQTVDRLYDRSGLAVVSQYTRTVDNSTYVRAGTFIDYENGKPQNTCYFPEGQALNYLTDIGRQVFELRVWSEDDRTGRASVCAGSWEMSPNQMRRYLSFLELEKRPRQAVADCDQWVVVREIIEPGRTTCQQ
jgi:hypothetical protein